MEERTYIEIYMYVDLFYIYRCTGRQGLRERERREAVKNEGRLQGGRPT